MRKISVGKILGRIFFFCLFAIVIYLVAQVVLMTKPNYTYETVIQYDFADSVLSEGYVLFQESVVEGSGSLGYLVEDGNRVSTGQSIAECYTSSAQQEIRIELNQINAEILLLQDSENTAGTLVDNLVSQRSTAIYNLIEQLDQKDYINTQPNEASYLLAQNKLQIMTGVQNDFTSQIEQLSVQAAALEQELGTPEQITAQSNGYFVSKNTASFLSYDKDELLALSVSDFADTLTTENEMNSSTIAGKVVASYTWHFVGVCSIEESERFRVGGSLELSFPDKTDTVFPATVVSLEQDQISGLVRVTLECEHIGADALSLGQETAEIIFKTHEGLRVPTQAVRMQSVTTEDGGTEYVKGVYVAYNGLAKFRTIEILHQTDDYILVPLEGESAICAVKLYDQVIISGVDLSDGKLL